MIHSVIGSFGPTLSTGGREQKCGPSSNLVLSTMGMFSGFTRGPVGIVSLEIWVGLDMVLAVCDMMAGSKVASTRERRDEPNVERLILKRRGLKMIYTICATYGQYHSQKERPRGAW